MLILSHKSLVCVTAHPKQPGMLVVCGRFPGDVEAFLNSPNAMGARVKEQVTPDEDYRFRAIVSRGRVLECLEDAAECITYNDMHAECADWRREAYTHAGCALRRAQDVLLGLDLGRASTNSWWSAL